MHTGCMYLLSTLSTLSTFPISLFSFIPTLPREIVLPSDPLEIVPPGGKSEGETISRTVGGAVLV